MFTSLSYAGRAFSFSGAAVLTARSLAAAALAVASGTAPAQSPPLPEPGAWKIESSIRMNPSHRSSRQETSTEVEDECISAEDVASQSWFDFIRRDIESDCKLEQVGQTRTTIRFVQRCEGSRSEAEITATDRRRWQVLSRIFEGVNTLTGEIRSTARWVGPTCQR